MPAGKSTLNWSPIMKQASAGGKKVVEVDELYEAAKKVVAGIIPGVPDGTGPHGMGPEKGRGLGPCNQCDGASDSTEIVEEIPGVVTDEVAQTEPGAEGVNGGAEGATGAVGAGAAAGASSFSDTGSSNVARIAYFCWKEYGTWGVGGLTSVTRGVFSTERLLPSASLFERR
jgi:hypothetical protein